VREWGGGVSNSCSHKQHLTTNKTFDSPFLPCIGTVESPFLSHIHQIQVTHYYTLMLPPSDTGMCCVCVLCVCCVCGLCVLCVCVVCGRNTTEVCDPHTHNTHTQHMPVSEGGNIRV